MSERVKERGQHSAERNVTWRGKGAGGGGGGREGKEKAREAHGGPTSV